MDITLKDGAEPYYTALSALLPPGIALNHQQDSNAEMDALIAKIANELLLLAEMEAVLYQETNPRYASHLLAEWEASFALPDKCMRDGTQTLDERRRAVHAKIIDFGGARRTRYQAILATLGYPNAVIERNRLFSCETPCDQPMFEDPQWRFNWRVNLGVDETIKEWTCESPVSENLRSWGNTIAECILNRENSITSQILFGYGDN